jgi:hypothetical protein
MCVRRQTRLTLDWQVLRYTTESSVVVFGMLYYTTGSGVDCLTNVVCQFLLLWPTLYAMLNLQPASTTPYCCHIRHVVMCMPLNHQLVLC